jgi:hypothetical protein
MKKNIITAMLAIVTMGTAAQTENPRGIYKMTTLTGKQGEVKAPYEQYKICTDSVTLMVSEHNNVFSISNNDNAVFNYTGDKHESEDDKSTLIYDSNAQQFKMKWWSNYQAHLYFPKNDWCIEKYESGMYSELGKIFFDALTGTAEVDASNPIEGTWRLIGYVDELRDLKKELPKLLERYPTSKYFNSFMVFTPKNLTTIFTRGGGVDKIEFVGKKAYKTGDKTYQVKWISKDRIAIEDCIDYRIDWMVLERVTDGISPLSRIARQYVSRSK